MLRIIGIIKYMKFIKGKFYFKHLTLSSVFLFSYIFFLTFIILFQSAFERCKVQRGFGGNVPSCLRDFPFMEFVYRQADYLVIFALLLPLPILFFINNKYYPKCKKINFELILLFYLIFIPFLYFLTALTFYFF